MDGLEVRDAAANLDQRGEDVERYPLRGRMVFQALGDLVVHARSVGGHGCGAFFSDDGAEVNVAVARAEPVVRAPPAPADTFFARDVSGAVHGAQRDRWTRRLMGVRSGQVHPLGCRLLAAKAAINGRLS